MSDNTLIVKGRSFVYRGKEHSVDDFFDKDFYEYSDSVASDFYIDKFCVNEVFNNILQQHFAIARFIESHKIDSIDISEAEESVFFSLLDVSRQKGIGINTRAAQISSRKFGVNFLWTFNHCASFLYLCYLMAKIPFSGKPTDNRGKFAVVRFTSPPLKLSDFYDEIYIELESPYKKDSIYRFFKKGERIKWVIQAYFKSFKEIKAIKHFYAAKVGENIKYQLLTFYRKRIVHACLYEKLLDNYLSYFKGSVFYSSNNLDRFSVLEDQMTTKYGIDSYCIPHGIEYGFKFPKGFSCNHFYTTSQRAATHLNALYSTNKYVFDESIVRRMYELKYKVEEPRKVVFFTEPREMYVNKNIISGLTPLLEGCGKKLYLKLHPAEHEEDYKEYGLEILKDNNLAKTGNICISRKSTVLIEALYNHSIPIAIITTEKDQSTFSMFPSLQAEEITKTYNVEDLYKVIKRYLD